MAPKVVAVFCVYREEETLRRAIESVKGVDKVVVLDGRFVNFPDLPDDQTFGITKDLDATYVPLPPMTEVEKRNQSFTYCDDGDVLLVIDGDEEIVGDLGAGLNFIRDHPDKSVFWVWFDTEDPGRSLSGWRPRLYRVKKGMHYAEHHNWVFWPDGTIVTDFRDPTHDTMYDQKLHESGYNARVVDFWLKGLARSDPPRIQARSAYFSRMGVRNWKDAPRLLGGLEVLKACPFCGYPWPRRNDGLWVCDGPEHHRFAVSLE